MTEELFWQRLCQIFTYRRRNKHKDTDFIFPIDGVTKSFDKEKGWLEIGGLEPHGVRLMLQKFQEQGLITLEDGQFRLTDMGVQHCERLPKTEG